MSAEKKFLTTPEASTYLKEVHGFDHSPATLESKRSRGGGPPFEKVLNRALYRPSALDEWAIKVRSGPLARTVTKTSRKPAPDNGRAV